MSTDAIASPQTQTPRKVRVNDDGSHTPYVVAEPSGSAVDSDVNLDQVGGAAFALGQTDKAHSLPVVLASDQDPIKIDNDTVIIPFTSNGAGAQIIQPDLDVRKYSSIAVITTGVGSGLAWTAQFAPNAGGTYLNASSFQDTSSATSAPAALATTTGKRYVSAVQDAYFQLNVSALTSGTVTGYIVLSTKPAQYLVQNVVIQSQAAPATATSHSLTSAATTNATNVKNAAGSLYEITADNFTGAAKFLKLYNKASAPTVGTDVPILTIPIPANGFVQLAFGSQGKRFTTGISYAITGAQAVADTTAVAAGDVHISASYI